MKVLIRVILCKNEIVLGVRFVRISIQSSWGNVLQTIHLTLITGEGEGVEPLPKFFKMNGKHCLKNGLKKGI